MPEQKPLKGKAKRQAKRANIKRVAEKYDITRGQARRGLRQMNKAGEDYISQDYLSSLKMVKRNSAVPFKLPHQSNAALHSNHHDFDPKNREIVENMPQHVKDSLHDQANKYGKSFWSDQHQVNVDPEDGVLSNRGRDAQGNYFKFETENKPIEERVKDAYSKIRDEYLSMAGKKKHPLLPAKDEDQMFQEFLGEYHTSKFDPETGEVKILKHVDDEDGFISEEELANVPSYLRNPFGR